MDDSSQSPPIVNVYEVEVDGVKRHLICFLDPEHAKEIGIDLKAVVGEFTPGPEGDFDPETFAVNSEFIHSLTDYMNVQASVVPSLVEEAKRNAGGWLYLLDPRFTPATGTEPPSSELIGGYTVDQTGTIVDDSFRYNDKHTWFDKTHGVSGVLADRRFYVWLHPEVKE